MFDESFTAELQRGKYTKWAVGLDRDTLRAVLWMVGELAVRVGQRPGGDGSSFIRAGAVSIDVPANLMATERVANALAVLVGVADLGWRGPPDEFFHDRSARPPFHRRAAIRRVEASAAGPGRPLVARGVGRSRPEGRLWIPLAEEHAVVDVAYQAAEGEALRPVGSFSLELAGLVGDGYADAQDAMVGVMVFRDLDGCVCLQGDGGRLPLGWPVARPHEASSSGPEPG